jgi:glycerol-3-phosphate dehydrogenase
MVIINIGQQDDSRMNIALALTAAWKGAIITNHTEGKPKSIIYVNNNDQSYI